MIRTSRKTGALLLGLGLFMVLIASLSIILAVMENQSFESQSEAWSIMTCAEMKSDFDSDPASWKWGQLVSNNCINRGDLP